MFCISLKKIILRLRMVLVGCALAVAVLLIIRYATSFLPSAKAEPCPGKTNEQRISFLTDCGWNVSEQAESYVSLTIPVSFDDVYRGYNAIQKESGFDLSAYAGRQVEKWAYRLLSYPGIYEEQVIYATVLVCDGNIIGGDIASTALGGFMHGLTAKPITGERKETGQKYGNDSTG